MQIKHLSNGALPPRISPPGEINHSLLEGDEDDEAKQTAAGRSLLSISVEI